MTPTGPTLREGPSAAVAFPVLLRWGLRLAWTGKRIVVGLALAAACGWLVALGAAEEARGSNIDATGVIWRTVEDVVLRWLIPLCALLLGADGYAREVRDTTLAFHLVRPIGRSWLYLARAASALPAVLLATILFLTALWIGSGASVPIAGLLALYGAALLYAVALTCVYHTLASLFERGIVAGLIYTFVIEGLLGSMPGSIQRLSLGYHARGFFHGAGDEAFASASPHVSRQLAQDVGKAFEGMSAADVVPPPTAPVEALVLLCVAAGALLYGAWRIRRRDYPLKD